MTFFRYLRLCIRHYPDFRAVMQQADKDRYDAMLSRNLATDEWIRAGEQHARLKQATRDAANAAGMMAEQWGFLAKAINPSNN